MTDADRPGVWVARPQSSWQALGTLDTFPWAKDSVDTPRRGQTCFDSNTATHTTDPPT